MTCSFLLTSHWPKQVTWPCLQPMGLRNITLDQEGAGNILTVSSLVVQRLFCLQPTPCPGVRAHFCTVPLSPVHTLLQDDCPASSLLVSAHMPPSRWGLPSPPPSSHFCFMVFHTFKQFSQNQYVCLRIYIYMYTRIHTHSEVSTEKGNSTKWWIQVTRSNFLQMWTFQNKSLREKLDWPAWVGFL